MSSGVLSVDSNQMINLPESLLASITQVVMRHLHYTLLPRTWKLMVVFW